MTNKTAVLIFANSSTEEQLQKSIPNGQVLFEALNQKTIKTVSNSGLPYFLYTEKEQQGDSFGSRFVHAIQEVFYKGYTKIITIGNDTPQLTTSHLLNAQEQLENNKFVVGPSTDGGFYLMGLEKSQFKAEAFLELPWQSFKLFKALINVVQKSTTEISRLEVLNDLDNLEDLHIFGNSFNRIALDLKKIIVSLFQVVNKIEGLARSIPQKLQFKILFNKGSPEFGILT